MQMKTGLLIVVLAMMPCVSNGTKCYLSSERDYYECWKFVLDASSTFTCDTIGIGGVTYSPYDHNDSSKTFLVSHSSKNIPRDHDVTSRPGTSETTKTSDDETRTRDSSASDEEPMSLPGPTFLEDNFSTGPGPSATTADNGDAFSTSNRSTAEKEPITSAPPTPAYSEVCGRSYFYGTTDLNYWFRYIEIPSSFFQPKLTVKFDVKASQDVHVALAPSKQSTKELYQVVIGGSANSAAFIKRAMFATRLVSVSLNKPLNETAFRGFWITYNVTSGHIAVGKHNKENPFIEWRDPTPLNVSFIGYATSSNSEGEWRFCDF